MQQSICYTATLQNNLHEIVLRKDGSENMLWSHSHAVFYNGCAWNKWGQDFENKHEPQYRFSSHWADIVSRIYTVSSKEREKNHFWTLLLRVSVAECYEDIYSADGKACAKFRKPYNKRDLLANDVIWKRTLREFYRSQFVPLSEMVATNLEIWCPSDMFMLWIEYTSHFVSELSNCHRRAQKYYKTKTFWKDMYT